MLGGLAIGVRGWAAAISLAAGSGSESENAVGCPSAEPAHAAVAVPGAVAVAGGLARAIAARAVAVLEAPGLAVVGPAVDPRAIIPAVHSGARRSEPVADARDEDGAPGTGRLRHVADARRWRIARNRDLRRGAGRGHQEGRARCQSSDKERPGGHGMPTRIHGDPPCWILPQRRARRKAGSAEHSPCATKWPRVVPLLLHQLGGERPNGGIVMRFTMAVMLALLLACAPAAIAAPTNKPTQKKVEFASS